METYSLLREFADSWFLIAMFAFFVGTWVFAFWPSLKTDREDAASIPFRDDDAAGDNKDEFKETKIENVKGAEHV